MRNRSNTIRGKRTYLVSSYKDSLKASVTTAIVFAVIVVQSIFASLSDSSYTRETYAEPNQQESQRIVDQLGTLPLSFETNRGQVNGKVNFVAHGTGGELYLAKDELTLRLREREQASELRRNHTIGKPSLTDVSRNHTVQRYDEIKLRFIGSNPTKITGLEELYGKVNYFLGRNPKDWYTNIKTYRKVLYKNAYPGIDQIFYGSGKQLEYDFLVKPNANPGRIRIRISGQTYLSIDQNGDLVMQTVSGQDVKLRKPIAYQDINGLRHDISVRYILGKNHQVEFELGEYDRTKPLVIDPVLWYSTYFGGSGSDAGFDIAVDSGGSSYITGTTTSSELSPGSASNAFVAKITPDGTQRTYLAIIGGTENDAGFGIAVDNTGSAYITGATDSSDFPVASFFQSSFGGGSHDTFITKLNPSGSSIVYSTYFGGSGNDSGLAIAVDSAGSARVAGSSDSPELTTLGNSDAYVTKLNSSGNARSYFSVLGGSGDDIAFDVALDLDGNTYVVGSTESADLNVVNALQPNYGGLKDGFLAKLGPSGAILYSTYFGGSGNDSGFAIAVDNLGNAYTVGGTASPDFSSLGARDVFVAKFNTAGSERTYFTILGGIGDDAGFAIAVDAEGNAHVTGSTSSTNFTIANPVQSVLGGSQDLFVAKISALGSTLDYSTYLGIDSNQSGFAMAVDAFGNAYVTGFTNSSNFPIVTPLQSVNGGSGDGFVLKIGSSRTTVSVNTSTGNNVVSQGNGTRIEFGTVIAAGITHITSQNNVSIGGMPPGFQAFAETKGFTISTSANASGSINICVNDYASTNPATFPRLRIFHYENGFWINRTVSSDVATGTLCARAESLGQFVVVLLGPPKALIDSTSNRAVALSSVTLLRDPFAVIDTLNFSSDRRARLAFFVQGVDLLQAENISLVTAQARDSQNVVHPLTVESVVKVPNMDWLSQVIVKLPDTLTGKGDVQVSVTVRSIQSEPVTVRIQ